MQDYYVVLGVSKGANLNKIKKAYRTVVKRYHPDITHTQEGEKRFLEIREAYETLSDDIKRRQYDEELERQGSPLRVSRVPEIIKARTYRLKESENLFSSTVDDFFEGFLPGFFNLERGGIRGKDLYFEAIMSPEEAASGGLYPITIPVLEACPSCRKSGFLEDFFCPRCNGFGRIRSERNFSLSIPPNVAHGTEIRLSLGDIGLKDVHLNVVVYIDPDLGGFD
ncbi:MAG: DnaJ domain-containing protein [Deltaproteobacteria bacterium]|nr:DnaJ domain-containing protein [Deltaproteobacteria bacterium]